MAPTPENQESWHIPHRPREICDSPVGAHVLAAVNPQTKTENTFEYSTFCKEGPLCIQNKTGEQAMAFFMGILNDPGYDPVSQTGEHKDFGALAINTDGCPVTVSGHASLVCTNT